MCVYSSIRTEEETSLYIARQCFMCDMVSSYSILEASE